jgi:hypothetical protein
MGGEATLRPAIHARLLARGPATVIAALVVFATASAYGQEPLPSLPPPPESGKGSAVQPASEVNAPRGAAPSGPEEMTDWREGDPVPVGYHSVERVPKGLFIGGAATFGSLYLLSALLAAMGDLNSSRHDAMYIPAIGPFLVLSQGVPQDTVVIFALDGIGQTAGLAMLVAGLASRTTVAVRNDVAATRVLPIPYFTERGAGLRWLGTF